MKSHVYVMVAESGRVKVGISRNPEKRRRELELSSGGQVKLVHSQEHENARDVEREVHTTLRKKRIFGEWFDVCSGEAIEAIERAWNDYSRVNATVAVRFPPDMRAWLEERCRIERRSLNNLINWLLSQERLRQMKDADAIRERAKA